MKLKTKQHIDNFIGKVLVAIHLPLVKTLGKILAIDHKLGAAPNEILIIKMLGFGSLLLSSDAILALKHKYPKAKITLIGSQSIADGARLLQLFDHVLIVDDSNALSLISTTLKVIKYCAFKRNKWCFDFEVYSRLTTIFSLYTFSKNRFGFEFEKVHFRNHLNTHNTYFNHFVPTEENYNTMVGTANAIIRERYVLPFAKGKDAERNTVFINNTCSALSLQRKLTPFQMVKIVEYLGVNSPYHVVLLGAPQDYKENEQVILQLKQSQYKVSNSAGKYSFKEIIALQARTARLIITIDSAPLHIAARLGIPMLAIWGPTQSQSLAPLWLTNSEKYIEINHKVHCSPCVHHTKELPCKGNNFCIKEITIEEITTAVKHLLNENLYF